MKASQLIKTECCGVGLLTTDKAALVSKVELLESQVILLENSLANAQKEIRRSKGENKPYKNR
jgi:hypothetical protein